MLLRGAEFGSDSASSGRVKAHGWMGLEWIGMKKVVAGVGSQKHITIFTKHVQCPAGLNAGMYLARTPCSRRYSYLHASISYRPRISGFVKHHVASFVVVQKTIWYEGLILFLP